MSNRTRSWKAVGSIVSSRGRALSPVPRSLPWLAAHSGDSIAAALERYLQLQLSPSAPSVVIDGDYLIEAIQLRTAA